MTCYSPIKAYRTETGVAFTEKSREGNFIGDIQLPCGQCQGCRLRRAADWTLRCMHEAKMHQANCFITLTYSDENLPAHGTLDHRHFQLYMKRLRKDNAPHRVRFYMCGEYGPQTKRPHYHACIFGEEYRKHRKPMGKSESGELYYEQPELTRHWPLGQATVQDLTQNSAGYCARYIMKKKLGKENKYTTITEDGEIIELAPEYSAMSLKPGIGATWLDKYARDVYPHDFVIAKGVKLKPPKYYDQRIKKGNFDTDLIEYQRQQRAAKAKPDNTPERLKVREAVELARIKHLKRTI